MGVVLRNAAFRVFWWLMPTTTTRDSHGDWVVPDAMDANDVGKILRIPPAAGLVVNRFPKFDHEPVPKQIFVGFYPLRRQDSSTYLKQMNDESNRQSELP